MPKKSQPEQPDRLFSTQPDGEGAEKVSDTWRDHPGPYEPRDEFDRRDANNPTTMGQNRGEAIEGLTPREAARRQNASAAISQINSSIEQATVDRLARESSHKPKPSDEEIIELLKDPPTSSNESALPPDQSAQSS